MKWKVAILTIHDRIVQGEKEDTAGQVIRELVEEELGAGIVDHRVVPAEEDECMAALIELCDYHQPDLLFTIGSVGLGVRDVAPVVTEKVVERLVPGIPEAIRTYLHTVHPLAMFNRGLAGVRGNTLIINLASSPKVAQRSFMGIVEQLPAAMLAIHGELEELD
jgi:molybdenum cofactor synthesis domain-containing protein